MDLLPLLLLAVEWILFVIFAIRYIIKIGNLGNSGLAKKQIQLDKTGRVLALLGTVIAIFLPRLIGVRYSFDSKSTFIYLGTTTLGMFLLFVGIQFRIASYRTKEETPPWIRRLCRIFE